MAFNFRINFHNINPVSSIASMIGSGISTVFSAVSRAASSCFSGISSLLNKNNNDDMAYRNSDAHSEVTLHNKDSIEDIFDPAEGNLTFRARDYGRAYDLATPVRGVSMDENNEYRQFQKTQEKSGESSIGTDVDELFPEVNRPDNEHLLGAYQVTNYASTAVLSDLEGSPQPQAPGL